MRKFVAAALSLNVLAVILIANGAAQPDDSTVADPVASPEVEPSSPEPSPAEPFSQEEPSSTEPLSTEPSSPEPTSPEQEVDETAAVEEHDREAIVAAARAFDEAYNAGDAAAVAELFAEDAELVDGDGVVVGRDAIYDEFVAAFERSPGATVQTEVEAVRFPADGLAIEEGVSYLFTNPDAEPAESRYVAVHVRGESGWEVACVRAVGTASDDSDDPTPGERLEPLAWLVGDWIDESDASIVQTSCRWSDDGNWLLQEYAVQIAGGSVIHGSQRIGWDPVRRQIRSWAFDSAGGRAEGHWTLEGDQWVIRMENVAADGATGSGTRIVTPLGPDAFEIEFLNRTVDGESSPDTIVRVVRVPPVAATDAADETVPEPLTDE